MLTADGKRALRAQAHHLKPVVLVGQHGVSDAVLAEIDIALTAHEMIKMRFRGTEREDRETEIARICATLGCEFVSGIGGTAVLWRAKPAETANKRAKPAKKKVKPRSRPGAVRNRNNRSRDEY